MSDPHPVDLFNLDLMPYDRLYVAQLRKDTRPAGAPNKYGIYNLDRKLIAGFVETSGAFARHVLGNLRYESLELLNRDSQLVMRVKEKFGIPNSTHQAWDHEGRPLFKITERNSWFNRRFSIEAAGQPDVTVRTGIFWSGSYRAEVDGRHMGSFKRHRQTKRYFRTRADRYDVEFNPWVASALHRLMLVTMVVAVDMKFHEILAGDVMQGVAM